MALQKQSIKQILVALDGSLSSISALENGVKIAVRLNSELAGVFVEDINLLRATQLPFTQEISLFSSGNRRLEAWELERQLRVQADRVRQIMKRTTHATNLSARFRVVRGSVAEEILIAGKDVDLLILGKIGRSLPGFGRFGSTARNVVTRRPGMTLVGHIEGSGSRPVVLVYDGSESAGKALLGAFFLQEVQGSGLIVYLVAENQEKGHELRLEVSDKLKELGVRATFRTLVRPDFKKLSWILRSENAGPVVLPCNQKRVSGELLCSLLEEIANPVLLVK